MGHMDLSPRLARWVSREFSELDAKRVFSALGDLPASVVGGQDPERIQAAIVIRSGGDWAKVEGMLRLAHEDWRDLLVAADVGQADWPAVLDDVLGRRDESTEKSRHGYRRWTGVHDVGLGTPDQPMKPRGSPGPSRRAGAMSRIPLVALVALFVCALVGFGATAFGVTEARARTATTTGQVLDSGNTIRDRYGALVCKGATVTFPLEQPRYRYVGLVRDRCPQDGGPATATLHYDPDAPANASTSEGWVVLAGFMVSAAVGTVLCAFLLALRGWRALGMRRWPLRRS